MQTITQKKVLTEEQKAQCIAIDEQAKSDIEALIGSDKNMNKVQEIIKQAIEAKNIIKQK